MIATTSVRKILVLAANPSDTAVLDLAGEVRGIKQSLQLSEERDSFSLDAEWAVQTQDLQRLLNEYQPHILHFIGHGSGELGLVLSNERGEGKTVTARALARTFQEFPCIECVVLNACYSDTQAQAISQYVPHVVGMNRPVGDQAAKVFSRAFYSALGYGKTYDAAFRQGVNEIDLENIPETGTPVLRLKDGRIMQSRDAQRAYDQAQAPVGADGRGTVTGQRVFISYRDAAPDCDLAKAFYDALLEAGHRPFMAKESIELGESWRSRIHSELKQCDYFLLLLSERSATSEMVTEEVKRAKRLRDTTGGERPTILPIRVQFSLKNPLNYELRGYLNGIQQREWKDEADTAGLVQEVQSLIEGGTRKIGRLPETEAAETTETFPRPAFVETVDKPPLPVAEPELAREPGGTVRLTSGLYVERSPVEEDCFREVVQPGSLIRIRAPRQMGKTSLMARVLNHASEQGYNTVSISFQRADSKMFKDLDLLLKWFCFQVGKRFKKHRELDDYWGDFSSKDSCTSYFEECLLEEMDKPLVLAMDEADLVFPHQLVADDFFGLLRSWYEAARYGDYASELWEKLRLVVVHSTEPYVPLNINQSPFNVGMSVDLKEFELAQVQGLAERFDIDTSASTSEALVQLVGGHPYLVRKALYHLRREDLTLRELLDSAGTEGGIYGDHLRRHWYVLRDYPELAEAFYRVVSRVKPVDLDADASRKLESMGLIRLEGNMARPLCQIYREYFQEHLEG